MSDLVWSKEAPTEPGWYWVRPLDVGPDDDFRATIGVVARDYDDDDELSLYAVGMDDPAKLSDVEGEWSGPIPTPKEPDDA